MIKTWAANIYLPPTATTYDKMLTMDSRDFILKKLNEYITIYPEEERCRLGMITFIKEHPQCFDRNFTLGHINGGALVVDKTYTYTLLNHHFKLDKWFQFGGHAEGNPNPFEVGWKETQEETGLKTLELAQEKETIFDVDIHPIPERGDMPAHLHYEIRTLLFADMQEKFVISSESKDLKWIKLSDAPKYNTQPAFLRLIDKAFLLGNEIENSKL